MSRGSPTGVPKEFDASDGDFSSSPLWTADELSEMNEPILRAHKCCRCGREGALSNCHQ